MTSSVLTVFLALLLCFPALLAVEVAKLQLAQGSQRKLLLATFILQCLLITDGLRWSAPDWWHFAKSFLLRQVAPAMKVSTSFPYFSLFAALVLSVWIFRLYGAKSR